MIRIDVIQSDITSLAVDAIVNGASESLVPGGGVCGAIHRAAGPGLLAECLALPELVPGVRCPTGEARLTGGHRLHARHVIHTAGPVWSGGDAGEPELLADCYRACLQLAMDHKIKSIAFPAIACGVQDYPVGSRRRSRRVVLRGRPACATQQVMFAWRCGDGGAAGALAADPAPGARQRGAGRRFRLALEGDYAAGFHC
jgi:O-acetyl-ADP-ribose deacetylase (regulator of RNase III)